MDFLEVTIYITDVPPTQFFTHPRGEGAFKEVHQEGTFIFYGILCTTYPLPFTFFHYEHPPPRKRFCLFRSSTASNRQESGENGHLLQTY